MKQISPQVNNNRRSANCFHTSAGAFPLQSVWLLAIVFLSAISALGQEPRLTKLAPDQVVLQTNDGIGQATVIYARKSGTAAPRIEITDAIGGSNLIPKSNITAEWSNTRESSPETQSSTPTQSSPDARPSPDPQSSPPTQPSPQTQLLTLTLKVETRERVEANKPYKAKLIFVWPDARQTEDFTILDATTVSFDVSAAKIEAVMMRGQPSSVQFLVKNTGTDDIVKLKIFDLDLVSPTHRRASLGNPQELQVKINPGHEQLVSVALPTLPFAGTYSGLLNVVANQEVRKSIPLTLTTRGPTLGKYIWLPFLLFFTVFCLGYAVSRMLENWFGLGGLQRTQANISLAKYQKAIKKWLDDLRAWEVANPGIRLPKAKLRMTDALNELSGLLQEEKTQSNDTLVSASTRIAPLVSAGLILRDKLNTATAQWLTAQTLKPVVDDLDAVDLPDTAADVDKYRQDLNDVLEKHVNTKTELPPSAAMPVTETSSEVLVEQLEIKVERMALIHRLVVFVVVFSTAYLTLYWSNLDFGSLQDYFGVFFWSLGLTKTGTDILAKSKSSYEAPRI